MSDLQINVSLFTQNKLKVAPNSGRAMMDTAPTIRWIPSSNITIQYIGFSNPVGPGQEIGVPKEDSANPGQWIATDANFSKAIYPYTIYATRNDDVVISSDPQIENEGKSGTTGGGSS